MTHAARRVCPALHRLRLGRYGADVRRPHVVNFFYHYTRFPRGKTSTVDHVHICTVLSPLSPNVFLLLLLLLSAAQVDDTVAAMHKHLDTHAAAYAWIQEARADPDVATGNVSVAQWVRARYGPPPGQKGKGRR